MKIKELKYPMLSGFEAQYLMATGRVRTLDLGVTIIDEKAKVMGKYISVAGINLAMEDLRVIAKKSRRRQVFIVGEKGLECVSYISDGVYSLIQPQPLWPTTLEINGIHMHRIAGITPKEDAKIKIKLCGTLDGKRLLDICTGLGYTAIEARKRGAEVISIEKNSVVLHIASVNPWSKGIGNINIMLGDAFDVLEEFGRGEFDVVIHDPPRIKMADKLYSLEFYRKMYRVLCHGGKVVHYTGNPGIKSNRDIVSGVIKRMQTAGFRSLKRVHGLGVVAKKL